MKYVLLIAIPYLIIPNEAIHTQTEGTYITLYLIYHWPLHNNLYNQEVCICIYIYVLAI